MNGQSKLVVKLHVSLFDGLLYCLSALIAESEHFTNAS